MTIIELQEIAEKKRAKNRENPKTVMPERETPFYTKQKRVVLENEGIIDPEDIEDYIAHEGYFSLFKALDEMTPKDVIEEIKKRSKRQRRRRISDRS